jgi:ABC-type lipoprotein release transport system permease subunit
VLAATMVVAMLMTWIPSRQAARIAPAEALRYE